MVIVFGAMMIYFAEKSIKLIDFKVKHLCREIFMEESFDAGGSGQKFHIFRLYLFYTKLHSHLFYLQEKEFSAIIDNWMQYPIIDFNVIPQSQRCSYEYNEYLTSYHWKGTHEGCVWDNGNIQKGSCDDDCKGTAIPPIQEQDL